MGRVLDVVIGVLLLIALGLAGRLALSPRPGVAYLPVMPEAASTEAMQAPGGPERAVVSQLVRVGEYVTVEDLARGVLAIEGGRLGQPLSAQEREMVRERVRLADEHRAALLAAESELAAAEAEKNRIAREIAATFTDAQKAWVLQQRDAVSVGSIEAAYWAELNAVLAAGGEAEP